MIEIEIPGLTTLRFRHLVMDVNGTLAKDGQLLPEVLELLEELRPKLELHLITADTYGSREEIDRQLNLQAVKIPAGNQAKAKFDFVEQLGSNTVVAVGNGANDAAMLGQAALGIIIIGPEGAAIEALLKAKVVVTDIRAALELLLNPARLAATLRR
jgi:P-type E1-E2 ATPase